MKIKKSLYTFLTSNSLFIKVLAEEPEVGNQEGTENVETKVTPNEPKPQGTVNYEDLIAKARKEEKDKMYSQVEKLKADKNDLLLVVAERDKEIEGLKKELEKFKTDLGKLSKEAEEGTKTNKTVQELTLTISQLESQLEEMQIRYETDTQGLKITAYKDRQVALAGGEIIPELVSGNTEEEIDASIELAKQRYVQIQEQALANVQMPRVSNPATSSMNIFADKSIEDISSMTHEEYAEYRKNIGIK